MALKFISGKYSGQLTTAKEICEATGAPFDATSRVMQIMAQNGLLKSEQGAHGGYLLVQDLSKISFHDLAEMILGPMGIVKCINSEGECDFLSNCNVKSPLLLLNDKLTDFYKNLSLNELLSAREAR